MRKTFQLPFALVLLVGASPCALAQQDRLGSPQDDRFRITAGIFSVSTQTDLRLDADNGAPGTELSAEDDLGLRDQGEIGNVEVEFRIRERHRVRLNYFASDRRAITTLTRTIQFGNDVYAVDDVVNSRIDLRMFGASYAYEMLRADRYQLGLSFGLNLVEVQAEAEVPARQISEQQSRTGPIPTIGAHALVRLSGRFHVEARGEYLQIHVNDVKGSLTNLHAGLLYRFNRNLGVGIGYTVLDTEVVSEDVDDSGEFRFGNDGPELFLRANF